MLTSKEVCNTPGLSVYSENYHKQDSASVEPERKIWNARGVFKNEAPVTIFSKEYRHVNFNKSLEICFTVKSTSKGDEEQQPAVRVNKSNPFIRFIGLKDEKAVDDAISFMDLPEQWELTEPGYIQTNQINKGFHFKGTGACFVTPLNSSTLEKYALAEKIQTLSNDIGAHASLNVSRHFHTQPISRNLPPHEDPPFCNSRRTPNTGSKQQQGPELNCDYLFTTVRKVDKESETGHLGLYLAPKGLGNVAQTFAIISKPEIVNNVNDFLESNCLKRPVALKLCLIDNKPGAGYAINQNTEYVFDAQKDSLICRNKENPCQVLFRGRMSSSSDAQRAINQCVDKECKFKVLHGYEVSCTTDLKPVFTGPAADDKEKSGIKREILVGRLSVIPNEEELPEFHEKKSTEYKPGE